ncbi:MAG TPA: response regulator [Thermoanaerobaculia bacterium]
MSHRILIVDDYQPILFSMRRYLTAHGFEVHCASEKEEAAALIAHTSYAAVVVDLRLTSTSENEGLEIVRIVKSHDARTPVVMLTAYSTAAIEAEALRLGAAAVLHKPLPVADILALTTRMIEGRA